MWREFVSGVLSLKSRVRIALTIALTIVVWEAVSASMAVATLVLIVISLLVLALALVVYGASLDTHAGAALLLAHARRQLDTAEEMIQETESATETEGAIRRELN